MEQDREDLLREATALVARAELVVDGYREPVVVGFRRDGSASVFVGNDCVFQFNAKNELRRAYWNGLLYKAERGRLASLDRQRRRHQVELVRHDLSDDELADFLDRVAAVLTDLRAKLEDTAFTLRGQVPEKADVVGRFRTWLNEITGSIRVAATPRTSRFG
jgi:hypothetical protein